jgi:hypothetical protein
MPMPKEALKNPKIPQGGTNSTVYTQQPKINLQIDKIYLQKSNK